MLGWVSTISRTLSRPVEQLDRRLGKRKSSAGPAGDSTTAQAPASAVREATANGAKRHEWQTTAGDRSTSRLRQAVPQWQSAREGQAVPEWKTDLWKRRVEGEAKKHFDGEIAGVGRLRS